MIIDVITIFPKMFSPVIKESIIKRAQNKGLVKINIHNLRDYSSCPHKKVDAPSYGGGGMVFRMEPLSAALEAILKYKIYPKRNKDSTKRIILLSPKGKTLNQKVIKKFLNYERLIILAPRYEEVDERVKGYLIEEEISIGDYVLSGGELPAMVFIDCLVRLIPGVVSCKESIKKESFENNLLDFPHYTRPRDFRGLKVPKVLLSGNHKKIEEWRRKKSLEITKKRRPDLLE
ncbi:MAG: tRNA (guanosine(37)-N1)-methyltransferase TrmD [Candidatus Omnitrophica bacterium]|nr:tRNA (guanosine(37)-N1)-methyltransferase TrmD [Candidatus Omnitrophota bacterium]MBU0896997.1 tRNA (guanosine(37)-N1)-methyltransferase TrmD [Candidatus Omnitrophota bacterium]MBU1366919.1 tRNA (guanosine(37)-N1)-methyltransferase TrmD [Candidatus Omnitrophota bacterium]MBU1523756.1 tRNA (guanosine(37)-N1)-methyltransferase TrmD [Candidatus Omnitrophota bacterium]MBU1810197.1 tRNA (guanosine(37)-N1)-methyltransferase TrmD [Candidatus Omnitrophota bacterium]